MIKHYLKQKRSWMVLIACVHALFLFVAFLDPQISFTSIVYMVFLSLIGTTVFFIVRYGKETAFYKQIEQSDDPYDVNQLRLPERPFEKIVYDHMNEQRKQYKQDIDTYRMELEQEKDEMIAWIHEIKTPLTTMQLMAERMEDRTLHKQLMVEWLRIDLLLDQQLHQKRIPFIENDMYMELVELQPLLNKEVKNIQYWCIQKGIGFDLNIDVPTVISDAKWLGFVVRQILTNAVKYSEQSEIRIRSYVSNEQIKVDIADEGRGIDPKDISRIFDKGFTSTTRHHEAAATGMGLYLVRKVTEALLIQVEVQSKRNVGTTFTLSFPNKNAVVDLTSM